MSKPATEARLAAAAKGFTQVIGRGNASLITKNPSTGKCCFDGSSETFREGSGHRVLSFVARELLKFDLAGPV